MSKPEFKKRTPSGIKPVQRLARTSEPTGLRPVQRDRLSWHQFAAEPTRYASMSYRNCGRSGLALSAISLGSWETFGGYVGAELARGCIFRAFNLGITHFDLANVYGTPPGRSEIIVGRTLREMPREEIVISTKAGYPTWPGPYGEGASRKTLSTSLEHSLKRTGLDYFDIFYSHRPDPSTPLEETLRALDQLVRQGKTLYVGLSNYPAHLLAEAARLTRELNLTPIVATQVRYNMLRREIEQDLFPTAQQNGLGLIAYSPLAQGLLTEKYFRGVPEGSRAARNWDATQREDIDALRGSLQELNEVARARGQTLPQLALAWSLRYADVTTALIGASEIDQIEENVKALENVAFSDEELGRIDGILQRAGAVSPA